MKLLGNSFSFQDLSSIYLVANTPSFLYEKFRENDMPFRMKSELTPDQLVEIYSKHSQKETKTLKNVTIAYAALVALTYFPYETFSRCVPLLNLDGLRWSRAIAYKFSQGFTPSTVSEFKFPMARIVSQENVGLAIPSILNLRSGGS